MLSCFPNLQGSCNLLLLLSFLSASVTPASDRITGEASQSQVEVQPKNTGTKNGAFYLGYLEMMYFV